MDEVSMVKHKCQSVPLVCVALHSSSVTFTMSVLSIIRQPGSLCTPRNFAQGSKFLGKKRFFGTKVTFESFLSISQNLKVTRLQGGTQTKLRTDKTLTFQGYLNVFRGSFMGSLCFSGWSDQKCCKAECGALKSSFQTRPM